MLKRKGYNIIELLVVITAISLITAIGYKGFNILITNIKTEQLASQLKQIKVGLANYYSDTGTYPTELSALIKKPDMSGCTTTGDADCEKLDAISAAYYGPDKADSTIQDYWAGPYVDGMETQGDCIKSVVGFEICYGGNFGDLTAPNLTQFYTTTWAQTTGKSHKQDDSSLFLYHVLSVRGVETEMAIKLFEKLNKRGIDVTDSTGTYASASEMNINKIINDEDIIGVGTPTNQESSKTIFYRFTQAF